MKRLIVCTGKIGHELIARRDERAVPASVLRVEQLYPVPAAELSAAIVRHPALESVVWVQEEPANMGAHVFAEQWMRRLVPERLEMRMVARPASASPASGSSKVHDAEQERLLADAFAGL